MISVIIPAFNSAPTLASCVKSVVASTYKDYEIIVVDDHSSDNTAAIARGLPCDLILLPQNLGAASARNAGAAAARGSILFFLDSDILVRPDSLDRIARVFEERPEVAALFGSYEADTIPQNFFSQYKNLVHHYNHQTSRAEAITFASGFGAVRHEVFDKLGGFDVSRRFLEDIEFGYRMHRNGYRVQLEKGLQTKHCKRYTFLSLLHSDVIGRAIPWTVLMLEQRVYQNDLNTRINNLLSFPVSVMILAAPLAIRFHWLATVVLLMIALLAIMNFNLLSVFARKGIIFAIGAFAMMWFGYLYSGIGALIGCLIYLGRWVSSSSNPRARDV